MYKMLLIMGIILYSTPVLGGKYDSTWNPPSEYDKKYSGMVEEIVLPPNQVPSACKWLNGKDSYARLGCARVVSRGRGVIIYINSPVKQPKTGAIVTPKAVKRHEMGHLNGWWHE